MKLHDLHPTEGSRHVRKRVGRGDSSGLGHTAGRGQNGQMSRSGASHRPYFEGGQIPLFRRLPKRGFNSPNHKIFNLVNLKDIEVNFEAGAVIDETVLREKALIGKHSHQLKILADGEITKVITVKAHKFSAAAKAKIEAAGGTCEVL
ncbi:MAG: 50S ribosomal protein L15 [Victivallaceae bacterium]|nr:50S ribosomal protein L15 [Victivallaceae bacterium]